MNSVKLSVRGLFNFKFFMQNLKKSKGVIILFTSVLIILNILEYISQSQSGIFTVIANEDISIVNYIAMFIYPVVLSMQMFGFAFSKKSIDFVNSMPISRRNLFITNTIGGGILIAAVVLLSAVGMKVTSLFYFNTYIPGIVIIENILAWTVYMIFIYVSANFAMTLVGNEVTRLIVTCIIVFLPTILIGFAIRNNKYNEYSFHTGNCEYILQDDEGIINGTDKGEIRVTGSMVTEYSGNDIDYETLSKNIWGVFGVATPATNGLATSGVSFAIIDNFTIVITIVISIALVVLGCYLYKRKKMEVCETSTRTVFQHNVIKGLTAVFVFLFAFEIAYNIESLLMCIIIVLMIGLYIIYDLITRKSITNILYTIVTLLIALAISGTYFFSIEEGYINLLTKRARNIISADGSILENIKTSDICGAGIYSDDIGTYLMNDNDDYVKKMVSCLDDKADISVAVKFKTKNGEYFTTNVSLDEDRYNNLKKIAEDNKLEFNLYDYLFEYNVAVQINNVRLSNSDIRKLKKNLKKNSYVSVMDSDYRKLQISNYDEYESLSSKSDLAKYKYVIDLNTMKKYEIKISDNNYCYVNENNVQCDIEYYYSTKTMDDDTIAYNQNGYDRDLKTILKSTYKDRKKSFVYQLPKVEFIDNYNHNIHTKSIYAYANDTLCEAVLDRCNRDVDAYMNDNDEYGIKDIDVAMSGVNPEVTSQDVLDNTLSSNGKSIVIEYLKKHATEEIDATKPFAKIRITNSRNEDDRVSSSRESYIKKGGHILEFYTNDLTGFAQMINSCPKDSALGMDTICEEYVKAAKEQSK